MTMEERARELLAVIEEVVTMPRAVLDPLAVDHLLRWVLDGQVRPLDPAATVARHEGFATAVRENQTWTISSPSVHPVLSAPEVVVRDAVQDDAEVPCGVYWCTNKVRRFCKECETPQFVTLTDEHIRAFQEMRILAAEIRRRR